MKKIFYFFNKQFFIKNIFLFSLMCIFFSADGASYAVQNVVLKDRNALAIRVSNSPSDVEAELKEKSFKIMQPYLNNNAVNVSVIWQESNNDFGKAVSVSRTYIKQYLKKQIPSSKFKEYFVIISIDPLPDIQNKVKQIYPTEISFQDLKKASDLREKADIMRYSNNFEAAIRMYNQVLELNPYDCLSLFQLAEIYKEQQKYALAREFYTKTLEVSPEFIKADEALSEIKDK